MIYGSSIVLKISGSEFVIQGTVKDKGFWVLGLGLENRGSVLRVKGNYVVEVMV
jgi:hypothetical protein